VAQDSEVWQHLLSDPVRESCGTPPDLERILALYPRLQGAPAFDEKLIASNIERLQTVPAVDTGHSFLDLSVKTGLAFIDATFQGDHPKYGIKVCANTRHDGFPPTIIAAVDALSAWGLHARATQLFRYWLRTFVEPSGAIRYEGTSLAELGQLLNTAALLEERAGPEGWWSEAAERLHMIAGRLLQLCAPAEASGDGLLVGVPEDDERDKPAKYFHNNAWVAAGLSRWAGLVERRKPAVAASAAEVRAQAEVLKARTLEAIQRAWPEDTADWWLPPQAEKVERPRTLTASRIGWYTNYRYWPELLSSGILPPALGHRVVDARLHGGGQFCGMTRFSNWLDDWPLADYLYGLWSLGRKDDFLLSLYGHIAYHQAQEHLTAYEQVTFPPGLEVAPYCLPCQLVAARAARLLNRGNGLPVARAGLTARSS
jgi:hypothetical protein